MLKLLKLVSHIKHFILLFPIWCLLTIHNDKFHFFRSKMNNEVSFAVIKRNDRVWQVPISSRKCARSIMVSILSFLSIFFSLCSKSGKLLELEEHSLILIVFIYFSFYLLLAELCAELGKGKIFTQSMRASENPIRFIKVELGIFVRCQM